MDRPMYCPMSFHTFIVNTENSTQRMPSMQKCIPDCAWAVIDIQNECYACGMLDVNRLGTTTNWRPIKDDEE